jgi:hypothetical protein
VAHPESLRSLPGEEERESARGRDAVNNISRWLASRQKLKSVYELILVIGYDNRPMTQCCPGCRQ